jgi:hypothetical protein|eukprot:COSAG02_NODE_7910_length_2794_cov_7.054174_2_plen_83_part_00
MRSPYRPKFFASTKCSEVFGDATKRNKRGPTGPQRRRQSCGQNRRIRDFSRRSYVLTRLRKHDVVPIIDEEAKCGRVSVRVA